MQAATVMDMVKSAIANPSESGEETIRCVQMLMTGKGRGELIEMYGMDTVADGNDIDEWLISGLFQCRR